MIKTLRTISALALCVIIAPVFTSCGDDDNDEPGNGAIVEIDGTRLTSMNNAAITYDRDGRLTRIASPYSISINYDEGTITTLDDYEEGALDVRFNGSGYISELSNSWDYTEIDGGDKYQYKGSGKMRFSYNREGNLIRIDCSNSEIEKDFSDGTTEKFSEEYTVSYKWENGNLVEVVESGKENEDGYVDNWTDSYVISYGNESNKFLQMPMNLSYIAFDESGFQVLATAGLFGNGPVKLPNYISESDDEGYESGHSIDFTLNDNGSIASETGSYRPFYYGYSAFSRSAASSEDNIKFNVRNLFVKRHARK
jgi:hypothetical protein